MCIRVGSGRSGGMSVPMLDERERERKRERERESRVE